LPLAALHYDTSRPLSGGPRNRLHDYSSKGAATPCCEKTAIAAKRGSPNL